MPRNTDLKDKLRKLKNILREAENINAPSAYIEKVKRAIRRNKRLERERELSNVMRGRYSMRSTITRNAPTFYGATSGFIEPSIGPSLPPSFGSMSSPVGSSIGPGLSFNIPKTSPYVNKNPKATAEENSLGEFIANSLSQFEDIIAIEGAPESSKWGQRSADYRITLASKDIVPADLYQCDTPNENQAANYISSKFDQADTIFIVYSPEKTAKPEIFSNKIIQTLTLQYPAQVRPRRLIFFLKLSDTYYLIIKDHTFKDVSKQTWRSALFY